MKRIIGYVIMALSLTMSCRNQESNPPAENQEMEFGMTVDGKTVFQEKLRWVGPENAAQLASVHLDSLAASKNILVLEEQHDQDFRAYQDSLAAMIARANESNQPAPQGGGGAAEIALEATKLAWDIIKDAKPLVQAEGAFTSILNAADANWTNYAQAHIFTSPTYRIYSKNGFGVVNTDVVFTVAGTNQAAYAGNNPNVYEGGNYIPSIYAAFTNVSAGATWNINATASVIPPANLGTKDNVNPFTVLMINLTYSGWFQAFHKSFMLFITGKDGVVQALLPPDGA